MNVDEIASFSFSPENCNIRLSHNWTTSNLN